MFVLDDENEEGQVAGTPFRWRGAAMVGTPGPMGVAAGRGAIGTPRTGRTARIIGRENLSPLVGSGGVVAVAVEVLYPLGAQLEHDISMISPRPTILNRRCPPTIGKVPKILLNITHHSDGDSACLTPQKKLLDNIDTVEKVVMEELRKLKRTPSARKAEREKRVRTLMSMR
ncbi:UNVERIFIED_CONTAM: protein POLYCHOME [Sesamum latifolium]|uniref:Protein POLYCHOME n=1 Tax=Sesamum latifolium TaxID=2727402 RepID=A0AAW2VHE7_9LAMI